MKKLLKALFGGLGTVVLALGVIVLAAVGTEYRPGDVAPADAACEEGTQPLRAGQPFTVMSWNVQYGASRKHQFFYDGGDAVHVPRTDVDETVGAIAAAIRDAAPQLTLIQEMDRGSKRTDMVDMLGPWQAAAGAACAVTTPYHRSPFVPKPFSNPLGRVDMHLAVLSQAPLTGALRTQLALLDEPRIVQVFNLKRALLTAEVEVEGHDQPLAVAVTHLSAFSFGDGTLAAQVAALDAWMAARPPGQPWILAGDMNLLPTGDDKDRLTTERDLYADAASPIDPLLEKYTELMGNDRQLAPENRTYLPFGATEPDRKIDYVFVGGPIEVLDARVMREHAAISDHLPVLARVRVGDAPEPPEPVDPTPDAPSF
jgi:endonuclease/exonuclease/phosphatase family metal-dependent hydrolase